MCFIWIVLICCWFEIQVRAYQTIPLIRREVGEKGALKSFIISLRTRTNYESQRMVNIDLTNFYNVQYFGPVYVGTPKQRFDVLFDTGSNAFWIPGPTDMSECGSGHRKFSPYSSRTYRDLKEEIMLQYLKGEVLIDLANETLMVGGISIKNQGIGLSKHGGCEGHQFDGIMGMSYQDPQTLNITPVFQTMVEQQAVPAPVFSFFFNRNNKNSNGGELHLGGWNPSYVSDSQIKFIPLLKECDSKWGIRINTIHFGSRIVASYPTGILDTGTSLIIGPREQVDFIANATGGAVFSTHIVVECSLMNQLPTLTFNIDGWDYSYTSWDLLFHEDDGLCILGVQSYSENASQEANVWLLGNTFLSKVYSIHDFANRKVALVPLRTIPAEPTDPPLPPITTNDPSGSHAISSNMAIIAMALLYVILF